MSASCCTRLLVLTTFHFISGPETFALDHADLIVVKMHSGGVEEVKQLAQRHGYRVQGQVGTLAGYYELKRLSGMHITKREAKKSIGSDPVISWHEVQVAKKRVKRDLPINISWSDPDYPKQWYLHKGAAGGFDMRVTEAWKLGYSGKGVVVSILDDGIQGSHPDLASNYDTAASTDINDRDNDPTPRDNGDNKHGTRCAGEVSAVAGNAWCGVGIAFKSSIGGVRMLDGPVSDSVEAASLSFNPSHIDIYSASWGPEDDGKTVDGPGPLAKKAFVEGVSKGRKGKGSIFIWASGNGGSHQDSCSCDGYTTSVYTLSVSSATFDHQKPWYLEECPSTLATTYSSGSANQPAVVTVDMPNSCTEQHTGTSASAPLAAGIVALALEANPELTWRDVQHLVVRTSDPTPLLANGGFITNGVGRKVSNKFGYGMMNAEALVLLARSWQTAPPQHICTYEYHIDPPSPRPLIGKFHHNFTLNVPGCEGSNAVNYLEQVHAVVSIQYSQRGDLTIKLISPKGTESILLPPRSLDVNPNGFLKWPFLSVQQWGENPRGVWTLVIENAGRVENSGAFVDFSLVLYGTETPPLSDYAPSTTSSIGPSGASEGVEHQSNQVPRDIPSGFFTTHFELPPEGLNHPSEAVDINSETSSISAARSHLFHNFPTNISPSSSYPDGRLVEDNPKWKPETMSHLTFGNCHKLCDPAHGCYKDQSIYDCVKCSNFSLYKRNRSGKMCVENCGNGSYANEKRCKQCLAECETCSNAETCDTCPLGKVMTISPAVGHLLHGRCLSECPEGFRLSTGDGKPVCLMEKSFQPCGAGYFITPDNKCVARCPDGSFASITFECRTCHSACDTCFGPHRNECVKCATGHRQHPVSQICEPSNSAGVAISVDRSRCRSGQYFDDVLTVCVDCPVFGHNNTQPGACSLPFQWHVTRVVALLCAIAVVIFFAIFGCLMWRDRHYDRNAKLYAYSQLPIQYSLGSKEGLINANQTTLKQSDENDFSIVLTEDSDEEDTLFPH